MTNKIPDTAPKPKSRKKLIALVAAGALVVAAGITTAVVSSNNAAYAAETEQLCTAALDKSQKAIDASQLATKNADAALEVVKSTKLPKDGGASAEYAKRPAVKAVKAVPAKDGKPEVKAVAARPSGAEFIKEVTDIRAELIAVEVVDNDTDELKITTECTDRDQAEAITAASNDTLAKSAALESSTEALLADFAIFQKDEAARIAAEKKAAEEAAAAQAAAEAAAAQAEAERIAAEQAAWAEQQYVEPDYGYTPNYNGGGSGGNGGGDYTAPPPPSNNGGGGSGGGGNGTIIAPPPGQHGGGCPAGMNCAL